MGFFCCWLLDLNVCIICDGSMLAYSHYRPASFVIIANFSIMEEETFDTFTKYFQEVFKIGNNLLFSNIVDIVDINNTTHIMLSRFWYLGFFFIGCEDIDINRLQLRSIIKTFLRSSQYHCQNLKYNFFEIEFRSFKLTM